MQLLEVVPKVMQLSEVVPRVMQLLEVMQEVQFLIGDIMPSGSTNSPIFYKGTDQGYCR